jgi:hypothetical protein
MVMSPGAMVAAVFALWRCRAPAGEIGGTGGPPWRSAPSALDAVQGSPTNLAPHPAERIPLSGSGGRFCGDLLLTLAGRDLVVEVKHHGHGFARLYS